MFCTISLAESMFDTHEPALQLSNKQYIAFLFLSSFALAQEQSVPTLAVAERMTDSRDGSRTQPGILFNLPVSPTRCKQAGHTPATHDHPYLVLSHEIADISLRAGHASQVQQAPQEILRVAIPERPRLLACECRHGLNVLLY